MCVWYMMRSYRTKTPIKNSYLVRANLPKCYSIITIYLHILKDHEQYTTNETLRLFQKQRWLCTHLEWTCVHQSLNTRALQRKTAAAGNKLVAWNRKPRSQLAPANPAAASRAHSRRRCRGHHFANSCTFARKLRYRWRQMQIRGICMLLTIFSLISEILS